MRHRARRGVVQPYELRCARGHSLRPVYRVSWPLRTQKREVVAAAIGERGARAPTRWLCRREAPELVFQEGVDGGARRAALVHAPDDVAAPRADEFSWHAVGGGRAGPRRQGGANRAGRNAVLCNDAFSPAVLIDTRLPVIVEDEHSIIHGQTGAFSV